MQKYLCRSLSDFLQHVGSADVVSASISIFLGSLWVLVEGRMDPQASWLEMRTVRLDRTLGCGARRGLVGSHCVPSSGDGAVGIWWRCEGICERSELEAQASRMEEVMSCCSLEGCC